jgi:hypothetical protein
LFYRKDSNINFTDEAKWHAMQTPPANYKQVRIERFAPRVFEAKIYKPSVSA